MRNFVLQKVTASSNNNNFTNLLSVQWREKLLLYKQMSNDDKVSPQLSCLAVTGFLFLYKKYTILIYFVATFYICEYVCILLFFLLYTFCFFFAFYFIFSIFFLFFCAHKLVSFKTDTFSAAVFFLAKMATYIYVWLCFCMCLCMCAYTFFKPNCMQFFLIYLFSFVLSPHHLHSTEIRHSAAALVVAVAAANVA